MTNRIGNHRVQQQHTRPLHQSQAKSQTHKTAATDTLSRTQGSDQFVMPAKGPITSPFGMRTHPITGERKMHKGIDIGAPMGSPVQAAKSGKVISAGYEEGYGNTIVVDHGNGVTTRYAHLSEINARVGDSVQTGQQIGKVGSTGDSTGPHLHFEVCKNGQPVDPQAVLKGEAPLSAPPDPSYSSGGGKSHGYSSASRSGGSHAGGSVGGSVNMSRATGNLSASAPANRAELLNKLAQYGITEDWLKKLLEEQGIPPEKMEEMMNLILSIINAESGGDASSRSGVGAIGLMQLMPETAAGLGVNPNDPQDNVRGGVKYVLQMLDHFNGDASKAVAAYNAGPGAVEKYGGVPPYAETQNYVQKVLGGVA